MSPGASTYVFVSYARSDSTHVNSYMGRLHEQGVATWRDGEQLGLGARWPKVLGDAIAGARAVVLFWSASAAGSEWVEVEWTTALALGVPVLPVLLDDTPPPPSLKAIQYITIRDGPDSVVAALKAIRHRAKSGRTKSVLRRLADVPAGSPGEALPKLRSLISIEGGIHVNINTGGVSTVILGIAAMMVVVMALWIANPRGAPTSAGTSIATNDQASGSLGTAAGSATGPAVRTVPGLSISGSSVVSGGNFDVQQSGVSAADAPQGIAIQGSTISGGNFRVRQTGAGKQEDGTVAGSPSGTQTYEPAPKDFITIQGCDIRGDGFSFANNSSVLPLPDGGVERRPVTVKVENSRLSGGHVINDARGYAPAPGQVGVRIVNSEVSGGLVETKQGAALLSDQDLRALQGRGVTAVVDLCAAGEDEVSRARRLGLAALAIPQQAYSSSRVPSIAQIQKLIDFVRQHGGQGTYVHCESIPGVAAVVRACAEVALHGQPREKALEWVRTQKVTAEQEAVVRNCSLP